MACIARAAVKAATVGMVTYGGVQGGKDLYQATNENECRLTKLKMAVIGATAGMTLSPILAVGDFTDWYKQRTLTPLKK